MKKLIPLLALIGAIPPHAFAGIVPLPDPVNVPAPYSIVTYAGSGTNASVDSTNSATAGFFAPGWVAADAKGNVYVVDNGPMLRKIDTNGAVTTIPVLSGVFKKANGIAVDGKGNLYVADTLGRGIRKIDTNGVLSVFAGINGEFNQPVGVATDAKGNVYVTDIYTGRISKITPGGVVKTLAGTNGEFNSPTGITVDGNGNVFVSDYITHLVSKITPGGVVKTLAGSGTGYLDAKGTNAQFGSLEGLAVDGAGNVFVADLGNNVIRKIDAKGVVTTVVGNGSLGYVDGIGTNAQVSSFYGIALDGKGRLFLADAINNVIREVEAMKPQTITFPAIAPKIYSLGGHFQINAKSSSGQPVIFSSSDTNLIYFGGNMVNILGAGTATITASRPGAGSYFGAPSVSRQLVIGKAVQTISFPPSPPFQPFPTTMTVGAPQDSLVSTLSGSNPVFVSSNTNVLSVLGTTLTPLKAGTAIITITAPETANYKKTSLLKTVKVVNPQPLP